MPVTELLNQPNEALLALRVAALAVSAALLQLSAHGIAGCIDMALRERSRRVQH